MLELTPGRQNKYQQHLELAYQKPGIMALGIALQKLAFPDRAEQYRNLDVAAPIYLQQAVSLFQGSAAEEFSILLAICLQHATQTEH